MPHPLIIVCDWIPPAYGAVGQYELARARDAMRSGRPTTLIGLGAESSDCLENAMEEAGASLKIVRLAARPARKTNIVLRALWSLRMNLKLIGATIRTLRPRDHAELKVTGSPPFLAYLLIAINALFLRRTLTYRMTDFYPETALAAGKTRFMKPMLPLFHWLRRFADRLEVLSDCQERRLLEAGVAKDRIAIIRDGSPVSFQGALPAAPRPFASDKVVLLYSGNLGLAHDIDTFAEAYRRHVWHGPDRVRLWLNATGAKVDSLIEFCRLHDLPIHVTPPVALGQLAGVLLSADAHLVTLDQPFWGYVIPSKIYACIESRKSVLYVGPEESDVHRLICPVPGCVSIRNGDVEGCLSALNSLCVLEPSSTGAG